jgi:hypothetical protein
MLHYFVGTWGIDVAVITPRPSASMERGAALGAFWPGGVRGTNGDLTPSRLKVAPLLLDLSLHAFPEACAH